MKEFKVYCLVDPINLKIRYIGITKSELQKRLYNHLHEAKSLREGMTYKNNWINSLFKKNTKPFIKILASFDTREEAAYLETQLILRHKDRHRLTNQIIDEGKFQSCGEKSAMNLKSKKVYMYSYEGLFLKEFDSIKQASEELDLTYSTIKKCLSGEYKYAMNLQFSYARQNMPSLSSYSKGNWKEVELLNCETAEIKTYPKMTSLIEDLKLKVNNSSLRLVLGALNKQYGNKYKVKTEDTWLYSTYYNTGVKVIFCNNEIKIFRTKLEFGRFLGFKGNFTQKQLETKINKTSEIKEVLFNLCPLEW